MSGKEVTYRINTADAGDMLWHLQECKDQFIPPLNQTVDISAYADKIKAHAVTFEAWDDRSLVGLIAAYLNNETDRIGFITNVSTLPLMKGRGIAGALMKQCIQYASDRRFNKISLEVNRNNEAAIGLYRKYGFEDEAEQGDTLKMVLYLQTN